MATKFHRQALADAKATTEATVNAAATASPTAAVTIEMDEPASEKETNGPSPKASNRGDLSGHDIGHAVSWIIALGFGFAIYSKNEESMGDEVKLWYLLAPSFNCVCLSWTSRPHWCTAVCLMGKEIKPTAVVGI